ncbi:MAG: tetratricopeptide repeat protein, partial [Pseudonocardiaceae bacterium]
TGPVRGFYPSLQLNLGECYRKLGDLDRAREHLQLGRAAVHALEDDGYGRMIKKGLDSLADRLSLAGPQDAHSSTLEADVRRVGS